MQDKHLIVITGASSGIGNALAIAGSLRPGVIDTPMQDVMRSAGNDNLPSIKYFADFKERDQLRTPEAVATYMADILLNTEDDAFKSREWNIDEAEIAR